MATKMMQNRSIDTLIEEIGIWSSKNGSRLSDSEQIVFSGVSREMQEIDDRRDYTGLMAIAFENYARFYDYADQLQRGDLSLLTPKRKRAESTQKKVEDAVREFNFISGKFYELFIEAAKELIESKFSNAHVVNSYRGLRSDGEYLIISPEQGILRHVNGTSITEESVGIGRGPRLRIPLRMELNASSATINQDGRIEYENIATETIQVQSINDCRVYCIN